MNNFWSYIEIAVLILIVFNQVKHGVKTRNAINRLGNILPLINEVKIEELYVPVEDLELNSKELLSSSANYINNNLEEELIFFEDSESVKLNLISPSKTFNTTFDGIKESLNIYFIKNKGSVIDFNLVKDVIERNVDAEDDMISQTINTPLYLGLMGTMLGIIFGLFNLYSIQNGSQDMFNEGISSFLISVALAMLVSFFGLFITVFNSASKLKNARSLVEKKKNDFYTLIQTELMPLINQSVSSSVSTLKDVLLKFNDEFGSNLSRLDKLFVQNYKAIKDQANLLKYLEDVDINAFSKANVKILKELKETVPNLEKFNVALNSSDRLLNNTENLSHQLNLILSRTNNFETLMNSIENKTLESEKMVQFFTNHQSKFEKDESIVLDWVRGANVTMQSSIEELQEYINQNKLMVKDMMIKEKDLLEQAYEENRSYFANLKHLENINSSNKEIAEATSMIKEFKSEFKDLKELLNDSNSTLERSSQILKNTENNIKETNATLQKMPDTLKVDFFSELFKNPFKKKDVNGKKIR